VRIEHCDSGEMDSHREGAASARGGGTISLMALNVISSIKPISWNRSVPSLPASDRDDERHHQTRSAMQNRNTRMGHLDDFNINC